jgi:hypothetical protein
LLPRHSYALIGSDAVVFKYKSKPGNQTNGSKKKLKYAKATQTRIRHLVVEQQKAVC